MGLRDASQPGIPARADGERRKEGKILAQYPQLTLAGLRAAVGATMDPEQGQ